MEYFSDSLELFLGVKAFGLASLSCSAFKTKAGLGFDYGLRAAWRAGWKGLLEIVKDSFKFIGTHYAAFLTLFLFLSLRRLLKRTPHHLQRRMIRLQEPATNIQSLR